MGAVRILRIGDQQIFERLLALDDDTRTMYAHAWKRLTKSWLDNPILPVLGYSRDLMSGHPSNAAIPQTR